MQIRLQILFILIFIFISYGGDAQWSIYNTSNSGLPDNSVRSIIKDLNGSLWMATYGGGIAKFDGVNWTVFNTSNSLLPHNVCYDIAIEGNITWIATANGVAKFDGSGWTIFNSFNSGLPCNYVTSVFIDGNGNKWFSSYLCLPTLQGGGLTKFDGLNWTTYNLSNSGIANNKINSIVEDFQGNIWLAHSDWDPDDPDPYTGGISVFDGVNFTVYDTSNTNLPSNLIRGISVSPFTNEIWATSDKGLIQFDGINWTIFDTTNSGIKTNSTSHKVGFETNGNKWIATTKSVSVLLNNGNWVIYDSTNSILTQASILHIFIDEPIIWIASGGLIKFDTGVEITENLNNKFQVRIFPNPVEKISIIEWNHRNVNILEILNIEGKILKSYNINNQNKLYLNKSEFTSGPYFLRLIEDNRTPHFKKIIIR